ncbi:MAG: hypothetical protein H8D45_25495 [Bacteroidetes bacterium]|nr:hypothetical protein [Bacteroidota bacterium]
MKKYVCQYCQSHVKDSEETFFCPECKTPHHVECWYENGGCAVYGCDCKAIAEQVESNEAVSVKDILVNAEYLLNKKKYTEAIGECSRVLKVDGNNNEAKALYNKAVTLVNAKIKLMESGDVSYDNNDYKSAEIFYKNALKYTDENESTIVRSKLQVIEEKIPQIKKRKRINNIIISIVIFAILCSVVYLGYYFIVLEEDRAFADIQKDDNTTEIQSMEKQISRYEKFIRKYKDSDNYEKAVSRISFLSANLVNQIYDDDWRIALKYVDKIDEMDNPNTHKDLTNKIYTQAEKEFNNNIENAKQYNKLNKFNEAKIEVEKALSIIEYFPESEISGKKGKLNSNKKLLNKKITSSLKYNSINKEISEKQEELKKFGVDKSYDVVGISAVITDVKSPTVAIAKRLSDSRLIAIETVNNEYTKGDYIDIDCVRNGTVTVYDENDLEIILPLYVPASYSFKNENQVSSNFEKESLLQRLSYLKSQRDKIDSLLKLSL